MSKLKPQKIVLICGARPNFMKVAPLVMAFKKYRKIQTRLIHTGQHYDRAMSQLFFRDLKLPQPDVNLGVGSATHSIQIAKIMAHLEKVLRKEQPQLTIVVGDVNSTLAAAMVANKLQIPLAHVEAGLRSFDRSMPEEINRTVTDRLSDYCFTHCRDADKNLKKEGIAKAKIHFVGNVMIDTLLQLKSRCERSKILKKLGLKKKEYAVLTLHRPNNVDDKETLRKIFAALTDLSQHIPVIFPVHPRTVKQIKRFGITTKGKAIRMIGPLGYLDFLKLFKEARFVLTDSGGIQEEATFLGIPCLTLRPNTERPITMTAGTNALVGSDPDRILKMSLQILKGNGKRGRVPKFWDGKAATRIARILANALKEGDNHGR